MEATLEISALRMTIKCVSDTSSLAISTGTETKGTRSSLNRSTSSSDRNLSFSPVSTSHSARTPTRSPTLHQHFTDLQNLDMTKIESPGIFLSPNLSSITPQKNEQQKSSTGITNISQNMKSGGVTPTNFVSADFGKADFSLTSLDGNNGMYTLWVFFSHRFRIFSISFTNTLRQNNSGHTDEAYPFQVWDQRQFDLLRC